MSFQHIEDAARAALAECGLAPPKQFEYDRFLVVDAEDGRRGNGAGRLKIYADGQGGFCQNWKTGARKVFFLNAEGQSAAISEAERLRIERERKRRQAEESARMDRAAKRALAIWQPAVAAPVNHPYLVDKQIQACGTRAGTWKRMIEIDGRKQTVSIENALLVPMFDAAGTLRSLQAIFPAKHPLFGLRNKDFLPGGGLAGLFWWIGPRAKNVEKVLICEGFATGATLHAETGLRVYLAFTANNLLTVGRIVRDKLPNAEIVFAADNDSETAGNPGLTKASDAAAAVGGSVIVPPIPDADFNDYAAFLRQGGGDVE